VDVVPTGEADADDPVARHDGLGSLAEDDLDAALAGKRGERRGSRTQAGLGIRSPGDRRPGRALRAGFDLAQRTIRDDLRPRIRPAGGPARRLVTGQRSVVPDVQEPGRLGRIVNAGPERSASARYSASDRR
jgi:hypothetical protein